MFAAIIAGWAFGWLATSALFGRKYGWPSALAHLCGLVAGAFSALGLLCIVGSIFDPKEPLATRLSLFVFGSVLLAPFFYVWRKAGPVSAVPRSAAITPEPHKPPAEPAPSVFSPTVPSTASLLISAERVSILDAAASDAAKKRRQHAAAPRAPVVTLPGTYAFSYRSQDGEDSPRTVNVTGISSSGGHTYLEGFCHDRMDNRTFRTDRIRSDLTDTETGELLPVASLLSSVRPRTSMGYKPPTPAPQSRAAKQWQTAVFFAGFRGGKLDELERLAEAAGWQVRFALSHTVDYVVRNGSAGKKQLTEADNLGIAVIDEETFRALAR